MWETWVWSLSCENPLEAGTTTHSSILICRIPWTVWGPWGHRVGHEWVTYTFTFFIQPRISILRWNLSEIKAYVHIKTWTVMFIEYLLVITKKWKQINCHSAGIFNLKKKLKAKALVYPCNKTNKQKNRLIKVIKQISLNCIMTDDSN